MARKIPPTPVRTSWRQAASNTVAALDRTAPVIPNVVSYDDAASGCRGHLIRPPPGRHLRSDALAAPSIFPTATTTVFNPASASPPPASDTVEDEDFQLALDLLSRPPTPESAPPRLLAIPFSPLLHVGGDVAPGADRSRPRLPPFRSRPVGLPAPVAKRARPASDVDLAGKTGPSEKSSRDSRQVEPAPPLEAAKKRKVGGLRQPREDGCSSNKVGGGGEGKKREEKAEAAAGGGEQDSKRRRFSRGEEVALLRGIVKHGRGKWRAIYDDEPLLNRSIQASALKDRVRSKRFAELLKRAEADPALLNRPDELCGAADQEVYDLLFEDAGGGETPAAKTKGGGSRRPPSRRADRRGRAGKAPAANVSRSIPPSLDSPPQSHGVTVHGARGGPYDYPPPTGLLRLPPSPYRGGERVVDEAAVTLRAEV